MCLCDKLGKQSQYNGPSDVSYASLALCSSTPPTLSDAEKAIVRSNSYIIDAEASVWLYGVSSNNSVQSIVLQAIANLPLRSIPLITKVIPRRDLEDALVNALNSPEYEEPPVQASYERLTRSLIRVRPNGHIPWVPDHMRSAVSLPRLLAFSESKFAADFLSEQIMRPSAKYDVAVWVQILANALRSGLAWLGKAQNSHVWRRFIYWFLKQRHACPSCSKSIGPAGYSYETRIPYNVTVRDTAGDYGDIYLKVLDRRLDGPTTSESINLRDAVTKFLVPSLSDLILRTLYPGSCRDPIYAKLPPDIRLHHVLIQLPEYQKTGIPDDVSCASPIASLINSIGDTIGIHIDLYKSLHPYHPSIPSATFQTFATVISSTFTNEALVSGENTRLLHPLFRALLLDSDLAAKYHAWMNDAFAEIIIRVAFTDSLDLPSISPFLCDLVECVVRLRCHRLLPRVYEHLCHQNWLEVIGAARFGPRTYAPIHREETSYSFLAAAFIKGLDVLREVSSSTYSLVLRYVRVPSNLLMFCKILGLSDVERCEELKKLAPIIDRGVWESCFKDLEDFIQARTACDRYEHHRLRSRHPYLSDAPLVYKPYNQLPKTVSNLSAYIVKHSASVVVVSHSGRNEKYPSLTVQLPGFFEEVAVDEDDSMV